MISRDGGWVSVMPSDARAMCFMYHVWRVACTPGRVALGKGNGNREKRFPTVRRRTLDSKADVTSGTCFGPRVLHIYCAKEFTAVRLNREKGGSDTPFSL